ncbi:glycoside hydrolase family 38 C-terminal domain-containing protein [Kamptonema cortianum]|nr:glycoside hydrolase family 38 C-terminal domain-containing protein [Geitlerinema splendidum]MDK3161151.1 glycoside hydrolase family 38 C-terminal domain-containing protein [Kamptonema cortianum]
MHKHGKLTHDRIRQFIEHDLREKLIGESLALPTEFTIGKFASSREAQGAGTWARIEPGFTWGPAYHEGWYRVQLKIPKKWSGNGHVLMYGKSPAIQWEAWGMVEGTVWLDDSQVGGLDFGHQFFRLPPDWTKLDLYIQTYAHNKEVTVHRPEKPRTPLPEEFHGFWLAQLDEARLALFYDCEFAFDLMKAMAEDMPAHATILRALNEVCNLFVDGDTKSYKRCRREIREAFESLSGELKHTVVPVGHAHLDTAWLWPLSITRLKMAHTTAVQLSLMEKYGEHVFAHSQASQYEWLEQDDPQLFSRVKTAAKKGQWEPVGSMWVEADCNLTGGESLVRQFLYGRRYFREKFGIVTNDMWLPDVFGYSAALPQILNKFNISAFLTQKMSWNQTNKIPHNTFWWQGIDGSKIWTHFPPADTYNATCAPSEIIQSVKNHRDKGRSDVSLLLYGFGDGGGGPTEWHLERLRRSRVAPGMPTVEAGVKAKEFFAMGIEESADLETWVGELYLEFHRGTYTSQAANKRFNRQCEFLMRDVELLASFSESIQENYPQDEIERLWKIVLLNQFHDIIPGSSVREVYEDSDKDYAELVTSARKMIADYLRRFAQRLDTTQFKRPVALFQNSEFGGQAQIPWSEAEVPKSLICQQESLPVQLVVEGGKSKLLFAVPESALGRVAVADLSDAKPVNPPRLKVSSRRMENAEMSVRFDANGNITSIKTLDEDPIEFILPGHLANLFQVLEDKPLFWDAWDTEIYGQETVVNLSKSERFSVVESGPVRVAVEREIQFGKSKIVQRISLGPTPGIRFDHWVDWQEDHKFLKVAFPFNVNTQKATYEIQFGHVERPTHRNTSWDLARFEVCAQKWADLSEGGHGIAIINAGKYGYDCHGSTLRLSLLRSPKAPDPICDRGHHEFSFVVLPHYDTLAHSDVVHAAYAFNAEPHVIQTRPSKGQIAEFPVFVSVDTRHLIVECVKKAEESNRRIVRLYECHNTRGHAHLSCVAPVRRAWLCDLEENRLQELEIVDGSVKFEYTPFEILTVMIES